MEEKTGKGTDSGKREDKQTGSRDSKPAKGKKKQPIHLVDEVSREEGLYAAAMYHIRKQSKPKAFEVTVELCGEPHKLETDTGATRTVLNEKTYDRLRDKVELKSSKAILSTYTEEKIPVTVVKSPGPNLLGRDWLQVIKLNWNSNFNIQEGNP